MAKVNLIKIDDLTSIEALDTLETEKIYGGGVTNLTTALGLPNPVSTVSASLAQDLPGLMFLATGSPTNRVLINNIDSSEIPNFS